MLLRGGKGSGKTYGGAAAAAHLALLCAGYDGMVVAPSHKMLVRTTAPTLRDALGDLVVDEVKSESRLMLATGSSIWYGSADNPESLEGSNLAWAWLDEARLCSHRAFKNLLARLRVKGAPRLQLVCTSTPGANDWLRREFGSGRSDRECIQASTRDNHFLDDDFLTNQLLTLSEYEARAYIDGEWMTYEGLVYPEWSRDECVIDYVVDKTQPLIAGMDFGYRYPAIVYAQIVERAKIVGGRVLLPGSIVIVGEDVSSHLSAEAMGMRIAEYSSKRGYKIDWIAVDPAGASFSSSSSERGGLTDVTALRDGMTSAGLLGAAAPRIRYVSGAGAKHVRSVVSGIERVRAKIKNAVGERRLYASRELVTQAPRGFLEAMDSFRWRDGVQVAVRGESAGQCDHVMDALRYMIRHLDLRGPRVESIA